MIKWSGDSLACSIPWTKFTSPPQSARPGSSAPQHPGDSGPQVGDRDHGQLQARTRAPGVSARIEAIAGVIRRRFTSPALTVLPQVPRKTAFSKTPGSDPFESRNEPPAVRVESSHQLVSLIRGRRRMCIEAESVQTHLIGEPRQARWRKKMQMSRPDRIIQPNLAGLRPEHTEVRL